VQIDLPGVAPLLPWRIIDLKIKLGENRRDAMSDGTFRIENPEKYDIATEVLSSAVRILQAVGFSEQEISKLFEQVVMRGARAPVWIESLQPPRPRAADMNPM
jgi:hypothetical protein